MIVTLSCCIDDFDKAHAVIDDKLFSIGILYCWVVCLMSQKERDENENGFGERFGGESDL